MSAPSTLHARCGYVEVTLRCHERPVRLYVDAGNDMASGQRRCGQCERVWHYRVERTWLDEYDCVAYVIIWTRG